MSAVTVQEVIDFSIRQEQAAQLRAFLIDRLDDAKDKSKLIPAEPILEAMLRRYAVQTSGV
jgi:hypothetical protein